MLNNIRKLRKEKKLTQDEVSKFLGIARGSYAKTENGINKITLDIVLKLSRLCNTSIEGLLCLSNDNNELDTVLKEGVTYNGKTLSSTDIIALKAFLQGLIANK